MTKRTCCQLTCDDLAEWQIYSDRRDRWAFDYYTEACSRHVGDLLDDCPKQILYRIGA